MKEALDSDPKRAIRLLAPIQRLFWLERSIRRRVEARDLANDQQLELRHSVRERRSRSLVARTIEVAEELELDRGVLPKSKLGKAVGYLLRQRKPLAVHLDDPRLPIHNNDAERDLRHIAVGRKNWQVFASPKGGEVGCRLFSLVLSAKLAGINVEAYLQDVLARVDTTPASEIASLTPWAWAAAQRD